MKRIKLQKESVLAQFPDEGQKAEMSAVLESLENKANTQLLAAAKTLNENAKKHYSELYSKRAKAYLESQEKNVKIRQENLVKVTLKNWLKENKIAAISHIRAAKAERAEIMLEALVNKFYIGADSALKTKFESLKTQVKSLRTENERIHREYNESRAVKTNQTKREAYLSTAKGLTMTQKEKFKALAVALPKTMTSEAFAASMKNIRNLVVTNVGPLKPNKTESKIQDTESNVLASLASLVRG